MIMLSKRRNTYLYHKTRYMNHTIKKLHSSCAISQNLTLSNTIISTNTAMEINGENIYTLLKDRLKLTFTEFRTVNVSKGCDHRVMLINLIDCQIDRLIVKEPLSEYDKIHNEILGCQIAENGQVTAPRILLHDSAYLVETCIGEMDFYEYFISINAPEKKEIINNFYKHVGRNLAKFHSANNGEGFGKVINFSSHLSKGYCPRGMYKTASEYINSWFSFESDIFLPEKNILTEEEISQCRRYWIENQEFVNNVKQTTLLHGDVDLSNIRVDSDGQFRGFVDFGDAYIGDCLDDLSRLYVHLYGQVDWTALVNGYEEIAGKQAVDERKLKVYSFLLLSWIIPHSKKNLDIEKPNRYHFYKSVFIRLISNK
ncbi:DgyrCDS10012 [Dimorphilus gyrociliatus]|uniref:DgyrCDS10012 n=1 Tax=Dimorphilus gyrociliatus TaxID=2664684 RepID=A0A7I8VZ12_9ANNE|nr:DgyrCDS10012 [Dimorphilus gyrociliatus]